MRAMRGWLVVAVTLVLLAGGCADVGGLFPSRTPIPTPSPTPSKVSPAEKPDVFATAVQKLAEAKSYRFTIQAVHHWQTPEGQEFDFSYEGEGAVVRPNRFYSIMRGPADTLFQVKMVDGNITNIDARGQRPQASTAFGGPGVGAAPYTVISYLKMGEPSGQVQVTRLDGAEVFQVGFTPNLSRVAAMDAFHSGLPKAIQGIQGTVWVDKQTHWVRQETVTIKSLDGRGLPQTATVTLKFFDYNKAVEIN
jgi:hypothetical protein